MALIECPVCTLYLRADMSLEEHLGTHPPDKVIKALVSMTTKTQSAGSAPSPAPSAVTTPTTIVHPPPNPMEMAMMAVASSSRPRTPPNALTYPGSGYEPMKQEAPPPPPPPPAPMVPPSSVPTAITVLKASDVGYPINNVMIVKSCSTKYVHQIPQAAASISTSGGIGPPAGTSAFYPSGSLDGRNIFIEPDRGGAGGGAFTARRQLAPSFYPRYTNERYSGPPPPYSTAISSTISASSQLQQSSMTGLVSKYEQKPQLQPQQQQQQQSFCPTGPSTPAVVHAAVPTIAIAQQQHQHQHPIYQPQPRPPPEPTIQQQQPSVSFQQQHNQHVQLPTGSSKISSFLQAQYTEKDDGNFVVTENPKKVVEYTENDEGNFMVIEKTIKSPPRVVQVSDEMELESPPSAVNDMMHRKSETTVEENSEEQDDYEMILDDDESFEVKDVEDQQEQPEIDTIEIVENEDGTFDDNRGCFGAKEMPKPMLVNSIGSTRKYSKFNLYVDSSQPTAGTSTSGTTTPRRRPTSGLKVLSNVKVTTDLSQGIKDIILNLNSKNKTTNVTASSGCSPNVDNSGIQTSFIAGTKPTAVVNNNCQNELIINAGSNMPPIDLNNVNDIEIINDDEEEPRSDEEEECYVGSMEVKATSADTFRSEKEAEVEEAESSRSASRATPTPSVITSVIRMTPHLSPVVVAPLASPQPPAPASNNTQPTPSVPSVESIDPPQLTSKTIPSTSEVSSSGEPSHETIQKPPQAVRKPLHTAHCSSGGLLFNKPPKKLTVKLKTPLPPAPPPTPPLISFTPSAPQQVVPKVERISSDYSSEEQKYQPHEQQNTSFANGSENDRGIPDAPSTTQVHSPTDHETKFIVPGCSDQVQSEMRTPSIIDGEGTSSDVAYSSLSSTAVTTYITTKVEKDAQLVETVVFAQSPLNHDNSNCAMASSSGSKSPENHQIQEVVLPSSPQEIVQTTTTTEVECFNITFIDDEGAVLNNLENSGPDAMAIHEVIAQNLEISNDNCTTTIVKQDEEADQKTNIAGGCNIEITEVYALSPHGVPHVPSDTENVASPPAEPFEPADVKSHIKIEKIEKLTQADEENSTNNETSEKIEEGREAKIEPSMSVTSMPTACTSSIYQNDQKDLLEAGPSRGMTSVNDSNSGSGNAEAQTRVENIAPTFLEYSAEYDDYVPVNGYGMPHTEQIPLSWVQKFSPQYTPFDDQNSYMDLDMCSSKTNSNSVGENSATSGASGSGSHGGSRNCPSMDRAPSAESLNIRTDEKMPAKGEISEQESNGDMELSWNRLYPVHENIPIYPSSYDLSTAQECWNLSNRHSSAHNNNSCSSNTSNHHLAGPSSSDMASVHHVSNSYHQGHQSHGISFQFTPHSENRNELDDQLDDKSKIRLDYGASAEGAGNYGVGLGPSGSGSLNDEAASRKLVKIRTYRCTECPKSFATLKQRRAHILSEHETADSKVSVMMGAAASATVTSGPSSTVTSASAALGFFSSPAAAAAASAGEGCSTSSLLNKKIKIEPQPMLMSYSSLKQELEQKLEGGEVAGPSNAILAGSSSTGTGGGEVRRKRTYVCCTCKQEFDRFKLFNAHLMTHPAECYACGRSFKHWPNFALHIKRHLGIKDHQCRLCGKKFVIKQKLIEHMRVHTGKAPIKCPDCDQHFRRFSNLAQHRNRHHLNKVPCKKDFVCDCGEVFQSKAKMEWHREIHENKPKSCPFCREKFIHKNSLTRHIRLSHTEKYVKLETATEMCTICNQPYIKTSMKRHMETHTDERMAFSCTICNKVFSTNWNLKQHRWTHANPTLKPFQCNMCSSGFVREADYITHMNAHKSIRPYTCNHCGCQFIRKYNWIRHTREHEMDKNYTCEICGRKFHRKYYLTEHKRIHTGERPFSCNICGKTSSTKTNHNKHIKIHHARDPLTAEG